MAMVNTIKFFNNEKDDSFIEDKNDEDIFVHYNTIVNESFKSIKERQDNRI